MPGIKNLDAFFKGIRVITFDAAGTLFRPHPSVGEIYASVCIKHGLDYDPELLNQNFKAAFATVSKDDSVTDNEEKEYTFWKEIVRACVADFPQQPDDFEVLFEDLWHTFASATSWKPYPKTEETLIHLKSIGYRLAVLSNWDHRLHSVIEDLNWKSHFEHVMHSSETEFEKPSIGMFRYAEKKLNAKPPEILHIGDSLQHDIAGANASGWKCLQVLHHHPDSDYPNAIEELNELLQLS